MSVIMDTTHRRHASGITDLRRKVRAPEATLLGFTYSSHTIFGIRSVLKVAQSDVTFNSEIEEILDDHYELIDQVGFDYGRVKLHLWRMLGHLAATLGPLEISDLTKLVYEIYEGDLSPAAFQSKIRRYERAAHIPNIRIRVPFSIERFNGLRGCVGGDEELTEEERLNTQLPRSPYEFRVFGFLLTEHTLKCMEILFQALGTPTLNESKQRMFIRLMRVENKMSPQRRADFNEIVQAYYQNKPSEMDPTIRFRAQFAAFLNNSRSFPISLADFYTYRGYEDSDESTEEIGIFVSINTPTAHNAFHHLNCEVCMDVLSPEEFPEAAITSACDHDAIVCLPCLSRSIAASLPNPPACPICPAELSFSEVKKYSTPEVFAQYDLSLTVAYLANDENFHYCLSPTCKSGQFHISDIDTTPAMTCFTCNFKTCVKHKRPWHEGETCKEFDERNKSLIAAEKASESYVKKNTKKCPGCKIRLEKNGGCDHFTCLGYLCGHEFCWVCLKPWAKIAHIGPRGHAKTCSYYS